MTDETYVYRETKKERERISKSSFAKRSGKGSKKCTLSSDRMTKKQRTERNGKMSTYSMGVPITWEAFKAMPQDLQKEYLKNLSSVHKGRQCDAAKMLGVSDGTLASHISRYYGTWRPFTTMIGQPGPSPEWVRFLAKQADKETQPTASAKEDGPTNGDVKQPGPVVKDVPEDASMLFSLDSGELHCSGNLRVMLSKLLIVLDPSSDYVLNISFQKKLSQES